MEKIETIVLELRSRLPELEWKLSQVPFHVFRTHIAKGLFRTQQPKNPIAFLDEIRMDLMSLNQHILHEQSAHFIADRIRTKIDLLVRLCILYGQTEAPARDFTKNLLTKLVTRRQQVQDIENQIALMQTQQAALMKTLSQAHDVESQLLIQAELGQLERMLVQAREAL